MTSPEYRRYIESAEWRLTRYRALKAARWMCSSCGRSGLPLEVHHRHYETLGNERLSDLRVLCRRCHRNADLVRKIERAVRRWFR